MHHKSVWLWWNIRWCRRARAAPVSLFLWHTVSLSCIVLSCIVLSCIVLSCIVLSCIVEDFTITTSDCLVVLGYRSKVRWCSHYTTHIPGWPWKQSTLRSAANREQVLTNSCYKLWRLLCRELLQPMGILKYCDKMMHFLSFSVVSLINFLIVSCVNM